MDHHPHGCRRVVDAQAKGAGHRLVALLPATNRPRNRVRHEVEVVEDERGGGIPQQRGRGFDPSWVARVDPSPSTVKQRSPYPKEISLNSLVIRTDLAYQAQAARFEPRAMITS